MKIPRLAREVEIIINMPDAAKTTATPVLQSPKPRWDRAKAAGKVVGASIVALTSITAIIVSSLALSEQKAADREQQQVNAAAAAASRRQEAGQVSFVQIKGSNASQIPVLIENLGKSPVNNPVLGVYVSGFGKPPEIKGKFNIITMIAYLELNDIPACSSATIYLAQALTTALTYGFGVDPIKPSQLSQVTTQDIKVLVPHASVYELDFIDDNRNWQYIDTGILTQVTYIRGGAPATLISTNYKPTSGCT